MKSEYVPPPRPKRGRKAQARTWATISGSREKGVGILNTELYRGACLWNRSGKLRDPETREWITRHRGKDEWIRVELPDFESYSDALRRRVTIH